MSSKLGELERIVAELAPLIAKPQGYEATPIERAAACAMLHSFYTQIEKAFELIARGFDETLPNSDSWHRELLRQMGSITDQRDAILPDNLVADLGEFLAFRHLFRGASIVLMQWDKLVPLLHKVNTTEAQVAARLRSFAASLKT